MFKLLKVTNANQKACSVKLLRLETVLFVTPETGIV